MKNLCIPFKGFTKTSITQGWSNKHRAFDLAGQRGKTYGKWMYAMENCIVENIMDAKVLDNGWEYGRGFGVLLRSITNPEVKYSYWHDLPFFPVKIGDIVLQGQRVAQMGNSGLVMSGGVIVKYKDKLKYPYPGTHVHLSCPSDTIDRIDWSIPIGFNLANAISKTLQSIKSFLIKVLRV